MLYEVITLLKETRHVRFMQNPLVLRIAAVILFVIAVGIPLYLVDISRHSGQMLITKTATDGNSSVDLPDGSRVYLNEGSSIVYPESFDRNRNVQLRGEAFFDVITSYSIHYTKLYDHHVGDCHHRPHRTGRGQIRYQRSL